MYLLMDSQIPEVTEMLGFDCVAPIRTVFRALEQCQCLALLDEPSLSTATAEVRAKGKPRCASAAAVVARRATLLPPTARCAPGPRSHPG